LDTAIYLLSLYFNLTAVRIFTEQRLKEYAERHPESKVALQEWVFTVKKSDWTCFADIKRSYNSVDFVGNQRYVFNIKGNNYRLVAVIKFTIGFVYVRFIGTHGEYDRIDCLTI
jgi:mRNA interferase HigB